MPDRIQALRASIAQKRQQLAQILERIKSLQLAAQIPKRSFGDIAAEELGGTPEEFQRPGPPGRPVTTTGFERDVAKLQSEPLIGLASRGAERLGARPVQRALQGAAFIPGPIGDVAGRGAEAIRERLERRETAREEVSPEVSLPSQIASGLADVGLDIGLLGKVPGGVGRALLAPVKATARTGAGRIAQRIGTEAAQGGAIETALSVAEGDVGAEGARRQQLGVGLGGALGAVIGGGGEVVRLRNKLAKSRQRLSELNRRRQQLTDSAAQRAEGGTGVGRLEHRAGERRLGQRVDDEAQALERIGSGQRASQTREQTAATRQRRELTEALDEPQSRAAQEAQEFNREVLEGQDRAARKAELPPSLRSAVDRVSGRRGGVSGAAIEPIAGAGVGAPIGAALDEENRLRGAGIGALAGAGLASGAGALVRRAGHRAKVPAIPTDAPSTLPHKVSEVDPSLGRQDFEVHIDRYKDDPLGQAEVVARTSRLKQAGELSNERVSWNQTRGKAKGVDVDAELLAPANRATSGPEGVALREAYTAQVDDLATVYRKMDDLPLASPERFALNEQATLMNNRADAILKRAVRGASQQGRDFNALKILANQSTDPYVWSARIQRQMGVGNDMPVEVRKKIFELAKGEDRLGLANLAQSMREPVTWRQMDYWSTLVRAGMLTLPVSLGRALFGNSARGLYDMAAKPAAVGADIGFSALETIGNLLTRQTTLRGIPKTFKGHRTTKFGGLAGTYARVKGAMQGLRESPGALRGDILDETLSKFDMPRGTRLAPMFGKTSWGDAFVRYVFGSQGAIDRPFRMAARAGSKYEQAKIIATTTSLADQARTIATTVENLQGQSASRRALQLMENPTPEMVLRSVIDSEHAIFQNQTIASRFVTGGLSGVRNLSPTAAGVAQATVFPFVTTPSSIGTMAIQSTPLGALATGSDIVRLFARSTGMTKNKQLFELQRRASQRAGRWTTGLLGVAAGYNLAVRGKMTGSLPEDASEREQWQAEGKSPYSVYMELPGIGKRWHPVAQIQPLGAIMAFGASLGEADSEENKGVVRALLDPSNAATAVGASAKSLIDLPFLRGPKDLVDAINQPERRLERYVRSKAGSLVPNIVAGAARAVDPVVRDVSTVTEAILARIPFASRKIPARPGIFGEMIERERGATDRVGASFFNVTGSRRDNTQDDEVLAELQSIGFVVPRLSQKQNTAAQFRLRRQVYGQVTKAEIQRVFDTEAYQTAPQAAEYYVQSDPRFMSVSPSILSDAMRREMLGRAVSQVRSRLTTALRQARAGGTR